MPAPALAKQIVGLVAWLAASYLTSAVGGLASINAGAFYNGLVRPDWAPPGWLFGPVWLALFTLMGIAAWLLWRQGGFAAARTALTLFLAQLVFNGLWSWLFFTWGLGLWALLDIFVLWLLIAATLAAFWRRHRLAAALLLPYWAWVSFAAALNFSLWRLNPQVLG